MLDLLPARLDDPEVLRLIDEVQRYYVDLYGGEDEDPIAPEEFAAPQGGFLLGREEGEPVAMGGWSFTGDDGDVKIRRMFVRTAARRRGFAAQLLDALEDAARSAGARRVVLATGEPQQDAIAFYLARGYARIPRFGFYADQPGAVALGKLL